MSDQRVHIRRGRRTDFTAVMGLLATSGIPVPPPDRATLRRFRNLVADLGTDFYLAWVQASLVGLVHVTYVRQLATAARAQLDQLVVADGFRRRGVGSALLRFVERRARQRGCGLCACVLPAADLSVQPFLEKAGFRFAGRQFALALEADACVATQLVES